VSVRKRLAISGHVQGVFFRDSCREQANAAGVEGSAQNLDDGRVEVVLEGDRDAVERVIEWCRQGPEGARVKSLEVDDERPRGESGFTLG